MTNTDSTLINEYAQRVEQGVDRNYWLGSLFWYSFGGLRVPHGDMVQMITDAGLDPDTAPRKVFDSDVFRRVCTKVLKDFDKVKDTANPDVVYRFGFEEFNDDDAIIKRITRVRVDSDTQDVGLVELGNLEFSRGTSNICFDQFDDVHLDRDDQATLDRIVGQVQMEFRTWQGCLDISGIRAWFRKQIEDQIGAFVVRKGGVIWFALEKHRDQIEKMEMVASLIRQGEYGDIEFHAIPLINDDKQRERVREAYEAETAEELDNLRELAVAYKKADDKKLTKDKFASMWDEYHRLAEKTKEHEEILESTLRVTTGRLDMYRRTLMTLRAKVQ